MAICHTPLKKEIKAYTVYITKERKEIDDMSKSTLTALDDEVLDSVAGGFGEGGVIASGSFMSNTGTSLNIIVNWYAAADMFGNRELMVVVSASSGNLMANSLINGVELSVNGMTYAANNNAINYMGGGMTWGY